MRSKPPVLTLLSQSPPRALLCVHRNAERCSLKAEAKVKKEGYPSHRPRELAVGVGWMQQDMGTGSGVLERRQCGGGHQRKHLEDQAGLMLKSDKMFPADGSS